MFILPTEIPETLARGRQSPLSAVKRFSTLDYFVCLACIFGFSTSSLRAANPEGNALAAQGSLAAGKGDYASAIDFFERAVQADPNEIGYLISLAQTYAQAGKFPEGVRALESAMTSFRGPAQQSQLWAALADLHVSWAKSLKQANALNEAMQQYFEAFKIDQMHRPQSAGQDLNLIGVIYRQAGAMDQAVQFYNQALDWHRRSNNRFGEAQSLDNLGQACTALGQFDKALAYLNQALPIRREVKDARGEGVTLSNIGNAYMGKGEYNDAIKFYSLAIPILQKAVAESDEANALAGLGGAYTMLSRYDQAAETLEQALAVARKTQNRQAEGAILNNLGQTYENQARYDKAAGALNDALAIDQQINDREGQSACLNNLGAVCMDTGQFAQAAKMYEAALSISRDIKDAAGEASGLAQVGVALLAQNDVRGAIGYLEKAQALYHKLGNRSAEASVLNNLGGAYDKLGQTDKHFKAFERAVTQAYQSGDLSGESVALDNLGSAYLAKRKFPQAISRHQQALAIARAISDPRAEAGALASLMTDFRLSGRPGQAIFYGKLSVAVWERIRVSARNLGRESGKSFIEAQSDIYRELADLLISQGRISEGTEVLGLLKEEEYSQYIPRGAAESAQTPPPVLTGEEVDREHRYEQGADRVAELAARRTLLRAKSALTPAETQELKELDATSEQAMAAFQKTLSELEQEAQQTPSAAGKVDELRESEGLMQDVRDLGTGVVAVCALVSETTLHIILITPDIVVAREYAIRRADLEKKIAKFRASLQDPQTDPRPQAHDLYNTLVGPIANDLNDAHAQIVMWSLDGALRYLPIAALNDGREYLIERYSNVEFTLASRTRLAQTPSSDWKVLGVGVSKAEPGFAALPSVPLELHDIVRTGNDSSVSGVLPGKVLLDGDFTEANLKESLRTNYSVVHIASHFDLQPENSDKSFLLLGDGTRLTLTQLSLIPNLFANVDLVTLSACNTAVGLNKASGNEWESLGMISQRKGAKAIIATLWPVADESTTFLMQQFYRLHATHPGISKADALRKAQLTLLEGSGDPVPDRFAHPYFWAPFVLIGNWK
jgi:CHAT domain-containing protein/Tfp pilus assembly protein PilF